ncbi:MAG: hypothetical protein AB3N34_02720 [Lettuce witches'-broom phytoplasma]
MNKNVKTCLILSILMIMPIFLIKINANYVAGRGRLRNINTNDTGGNPYPNKPTTVDAKEQGIGGEKKEGEKKNKGEVSKNSDPTGQESKKTKKEDKPKKVKEAST